MPELRGLYVIADSSLSQPDGCLDQKVAAAIQGGARLVQIRDKRPRPDIDELHAIARVCNRHGVPLLINDNIELALQVNAAGVHLGQSDCHLLQARQRLGPEALIGITCHDQLDLALAAEADGANYVAFGRFFTSHTKPEAPHAEVDILHQAKHSLQIPIVAIGGITPDNGASLIQAGADMLAVIHGVFGQTDIEDAARRYTDLFRIQHKDASAQTSQEIS